jgi:hypothetical protein
MRKSRHHLVILCTLLVNAFTTGSVLAEQAGGHDTHREQLIWVEAVEGTGFITQVPAIDSQLLVERIAQLRTELIRHQQQLTLAVEETRLDAGDAVITAIMPGGLLYAGYRKRAHTLATNRLATVTDDIDELTRDLAASRSLASTVAQLD